MGLNLKKNEQGLYMIHDDGNWITEDELKKTLIEMEYVNFVENVIKIDMLFPVHYNINGKKQGGNIDYYNWLQKVYSSEKCDEILKGKYEEILAKLNITL